MARILMLTTQFSRPDEPADMPHQLADAFVALGHSVKVVVVPWQHAQERVEEHVEQDGLAVLRVPPLRRQPLGRVGALAARWVLSSWLARKHARRFLAGERFDLIYTSSPAVALGSLIDWALCRFRARSYLYVVDFFPFHQHAIGLLPGGPLLWAARRRETALIRRFDVIGCMSPRNADYLRAHYPLRDGQRVELLPLSTAIAPPPQGDRAGTRARHGLPPAKVIAVFGGQITEGRGIELILEVAAAARSQVPGLHILFVGTGRLSHLVEEAASAAQSNVSLIPGLPRDAYLELAAACDIGLVVTVPIADIPTFPSKTLDYLQAGLPVVAAVEAATDYRDFVQDHGFGVVVEAGDREALLDALKRLASSEQLREGLAKAGDRVLRDVFDVRHAADRILQQALGLSPT